MEKQAALMTEDNANEGRLYLALELSKKRWKLGFRDGRSGRARIRSIEAGNLQGLGEEIEQAKRHFDLAATVVTVSCYEAGRGLLSIMLCPRVES